MNMNDYLPLGDRLRGRDPKPHPHNPNFLTCRVGRGRNPTIFKLTIYEPSANTLSGYRWVGDVRKTTSWKGKWVAFTTHGDSFIQAYFQTEAQAEEFLIKVTS